MDCGKVEKLLSLHASGDLEDEHTHAAVSLHLRSCSVCRRLADEYGESLHLLRSACAPPEFDASFYNGIRSTVLKAINNEAAALTPWQLPFQLLRRRLTLAAPVVLLLAAGALAVYVSLRERDLEATGYRVTAVTETNVTEKPVDPKEKVLQQNGLTPAPLTAASPPRRTPRIEAAKRASKLDELRTQANTEVVSVLPLPAAQLPVVIAEPHVGEETIASTTVEATRIEIQTSDPNIRIIWFAFKGTE